jgi:hypothetical protein
MGGLTLICWTHDLYMQSYNESALLLKHPIFEVTRYDLKMYDLRPIVTPCSFPILDPLPCMLRNSKQQQRRLNRISLDVDPCGAGFTIKDGKTRCSVRYIIGTVMANHHLPVGK